MTLSLTSVSSTILVLSTVVLYGFFAAIITPSSPFAINGEDYNITCNTETAQESVTWTLDDGVMRQNFLNCFTEDIHGHQSQRYIFFCTNKTDFILNIPGTTISEEQGKSVKCFGDTPSSSFTIDVLHEPHSNLTITGYSGSILFPGKNLTLKCSSYGGRPFANLSWTCGDKSLQGRQYNSSTNSINELNLYLNQNLSGKLCICTATHPIWQTSLKKSSYLLEIYYAPPKTPGITGYKNFQSLLEGEQINLTCTVYGGYPHPSLSWTCGGMAMDAINRSSGDVAQIVLSLFINRTLNGRQCFCKGRSPANYNGTSKVTLIVIYPPTVALFSYEERFSNRTQYSIYCQINDGNPRSYTISWSQTVANIVVRTNRDLATLQSNNGHNLTLIASSHNDVGLYTCSVHNNVIDSQGNLLQNKSVYIRRNSLFPFGNGQVFRAVYGNSLEIKIPFYCQPAVKKIDDLMWFKEDKKKQLSEKSNEFKFYFLITKMKIQFYKEYIGVEGQMATMTIRQVSHTINGYYLLKIRNMKNEYNQFRFKIEVDGQENISLPIIIGCSVAGLVVVAVVVIIILRLVMKCRTNNDKDRDEKQRSDKDCKRKKETYRESYSYEDVNETNKNKNNEEQRPISHQYEDIIERNQNNEAKEENQLSYQYEDIIGPNKNSRAKVQRPISHQYALLCNNKHPTSHVNKQCKQTGMCN